jgi:hypothetical protein
MANYTDKVIKELEPDNTKLLKQRVKEFCDKYSDDDIEILNKLSELVDDLWMRTILARQKVEVKTEDSLSVFGHDEGEYKEHLTIREKDTIYQNIYKSIGGDNASPYARLKAAMDYWCALWFWPIDKAELFPSRQEFFMELSLILEGGINATIKKKTNVGQMELLMDEKGQFAGFGVQGSELANEVKAQIDGLGVVNLEQIRGLYPRLQIADNIAKQQRFMHWELEFADLFYERGGFDLVIGNPPWIKIEWREQDVLSDKNPIFAIRNLSANDILRNRNDALFDYKTKVSYFAEYESMAGEQNYLNAYENYSLLKGQQTNLYKCFLPKSWEISVSTAVSAFVHPNGIFDDPNGKILRKTVYPKMRYHFHYINALNLFADVDWHTEYSLNVYCNEETDSFDYIANLYTPETIEECYDSNISNKLMGIKDDNDHWNTKGHPDRVIKVGQSELLQFASFLDGSSDWQCARLPLLHVKQFSDVIGVFVGQKKTIYSLGKDVFTAEMWHETNSQKDGTIKVCEHFPESPADLRYTGPLFGIANPISKGAQRICDTNRSYDCIDLTQINEKFIQRCKYNIGTSFEEYERKTPKTPWGDNNTKWPRIIMRNMFNQKGERTLIAAISPKYAGHVHAVLEILFKNTEYTASMAGSMASIPYDFYIKLTGKGSGGIGVVGPLPIIMDNRIVLRALMLNCLNSFYSDLWSELYIEDFNKDKWAKSDDRLSAKRFSNLKEAWEWNTPLRTDFERREALVELDVLTAMLLGMTLEQLKTIYYIQFPVLRSYESETWYDRRGRIVFTGNRSLKDVGLSRKEWDEVRNMQEGIVTQIITDDTMPDGPIERIIEYVAPFDRCDREKDYEEVWANFEERIK